MFLGEWIGVSLGGRMWGRSEIEVVINRRCIGVADNVLQIP